MEVLIRYSAKPKKKLQLSTTCAAKTRKLPQLKCQNRNLKKNKEVTDEAQKTVRAAQETLKRQLSWTVGTDELIWRLHVSLRTCWNSSVSSSLDLELSRCPKMTSRVSVWIMILCQSSFLHNAAFISCGCASVHRYAGTNNTGLQTRVGFIFI